ncbi:MAG: DMT family transporter [Promethearchaeota archaeon]
MKKTKQSSYVIAVFAMIIWGTTFPLSKLVIPPLSGPLFTSIRVILALVVFLMYLLVVHQIRAFWQVFTSHFWLFLLLGGGLYGLSYAVQYYGIQFTTAINQSILSNSTTFFVIFLNFILYRRKPQKKFVFGLIFGIVGVLFIMVDDTFSFSTDTLWGDLLTLLSFLFWAGYIVWSKPITEKENSLHVLTAIFVGALIVLIPLSFIDHGYTALQDLTASQWGILVYLGVICSGIATLLYTISLSNEAISSENMSLISLLLPIVAIITSILLLDEVFSWRILIGVILILVSVVIAEREPKNRKEKTEEIDHLGGNLKSG